MLIALLLAVPALAGKKPNVLYNQSRLATGLSAKGEPFAQVSYGLGVEFGLGLRLGGRLIIEHVPLLDVLELGGMDDLLLGGGGAFHLAYHGAIGLGTTEAYVGVSPGLTGGLGFIGTKSNAVKPVWRPMVQAEAGLRWKWRLNIRSWLSMSTGGLIDATAGAAAGTVGATIYAGRAADPIYGDLLPPTGLIDWSTGYQCLQENQAECPIPSFDVIAVLGCPSEADGRPSSCQTERIAGALRLWRAGHGARFIVSGGAVSNGFVEAESMKTQLTEAGVPPEAIALEPRARHTDENILYISQIMEHDGLETAAIVGHPKQILFAAVCDANCCVKRGRLAPVSYPLKGGDLLVGSYVLTPPAEPVSQAECRHISRKSKAMCLFLSERHSCAE